MGTDRIPAIASIHDVEPSRLDRVLDLVDLLESAGHPPGILLVVPGAEWPKAALAEIRSLSDGGWMLAGHGWRHRAPSPRGFYHRLHAAVLSRDQAEHLSRPIDDLVDRLERCHAWFGERALPTPELYVPPAWAMGALTADELRRLPFVWYETLSGIVRPETGKRALLPLVGYEADTRGREMGLEAWNRLNSRAAPLLRLPVRMAIHPDDLHLRLARRLRIHVRSVFTVLDARVWLSTNLPESAARRGVGRKAGDAIDPRLPIPPPPRQSPTASTASVTSPVSSPESACT